MKKIILIFAAVLLFVSGCTTVPDVTVCPSATLSVKPSVSVNAGTMEADNGLDTFVERAYELRFIFAVEDFENPCQIPAGKLVQYAFCHLYSDSLTDVKEYEGPVYRRAYPQDINNLIKQHFGQECADITESDLYNAAEGYFEMWEPSYATELFYDASFSDRTVEATFYTDAGKSRIKGAVIITLGTDRTITAIKGR